PGDGVACGDGGIRLQVERRIAAGVEATVVTGGRLQGRPGVTAPEGRVALAMPTPEDLEHLEVLTAEGVDAVAASFVRSAADIEALRRAAGPSCPMLVAKIETHEAVANLD